MIELSIIKPDDLHNHLRQGEMMHRLVKETSRVFARTLVMPNTIPPITSAEGVKAYREELQSVGTDLEFLMTFKIMPYMRPETIPELKSAGAIAGKLYPKGVSTYSEDGVMDFEALYPVFEAMQGQDLVLCIHGEMPGVNELCAEQEFLGIFKSIHEDFPRLRMVLEHVSSRAGVEMVKQCGAKVGASITVHHLLLTINDVRSADAINPYHYSRPICKSEQDRRALMEALFSGNDRFFLGTDSAPHLREDKDQYSPARGVYTTPVALPLLAELFEGADKLDRLEAFTSKFGAHFYQLPENDIHLMLIKKSWLVPDEYFGVVALRSGERIEWSVQVE